VDDNRKPALCQRKESASGDFLQNADLPRMLARRSFAATEDVAILVRVARRYAY
jgi:hypothetical protein